MSDRDFYIGFAFGTVGMLIVSCILDRCITPASTERLRNDCVAHGAAHWSVDSKGVTTWEWNQPSEKGTK